jgi:LysR family hydrogen peroxide-inducible transcriptional activator
MPLEIEENITNNLQDKLKKGIIDAAVIALPFDIPSIETIELYDEEFVAVVPSNHAWSSKKRISSKELSSEKVLLLDNTHYFSSQVQEACPGLSKKSEIQVGNSLETIRNMVASNLGISVLPKSAVALKHHNPLVNVISFEKPVPFRRVALAFRKSSVKKDAIEQIAQVIKGVDLETFNP